MFFSSIVNIIWERDFSSMLLNFLHFARNCASYIISLLIMSNVSFINLILIEYNYNRQYCIDKDIKFYYKNIIWTIYNLEKYNIEKNSFSNMLKLL